VVKSTSSSLSISVDGDLSKDELADLQKVLKALGQAASASRRAACPVATADTTITGATAVRTWTPSQASRAR
jgi:hypothetical protein